MKFEQWILRQIIKVVATRSQILRLKCTKFDLGPRWGATAFPRPPSWNKRRKGGEEWKEERG